MYVCMYIYIYIYIHIHNTYNRGRMDIHLLNGMFQRIVTFPVDVHWICPMGFHWNFPMTFHFCGRETPRRITARPVSARSRRVGFRDAS